MTAPLGVTNKHLVDQIMAASKKNTPRPQSKAGQGTIITCETSEEAERVSAKFSQAAADY